MDCNKLINKLLKSENPSIRWKTRVLVYREDPLSKECIKISASIKKSPLVTQLLQNFKKGEIISRRCIYDKWQGAHWIFASLADIGYPQNDSRLKAEMNRLYDFWLNKEYRNVIVAKNKREAYKKGGVILLNDRYRRCASQQGNLLDYSIKLGLDDERNDELVKLLMKWQWPDGGWNCDSKPEACHSSFIHTAIALKGLNTYYQKHKNRQCKKVINRAAEVFLDRELVFRKKDGSIIKDEFLKLHYPLYWHYDILGMLIIFLESGHLKDKRCDKALEIIASKLSIDKGLGNNGKYYKVSNEILPNNDYFDWSKSSSDIKNEWITVHAIAVLNHRGMIKV